MTNHRKQEGKHPYIGACTQTICVHRLGALVYPKDMFVYVGWQDGIEFNSATQSDRYHLECMSASLSLSLSPSPLGPSNG